MTSTSDVGLGVICFDTLDVAENCAVVQVANSARHPRYGLRPGEPCGCGKTITVKGAKQERWSS